VRLLTSMPALSAAEPATQRFIDPKADDALRRMSSVLQAAKSSSFRAHATVDQVTPERRAVRHRFAIRTTTDRGSTG
jgi:hypothetical protein